MRVASKSCILHASTVVRPCFTCHLFCRYTWVSKRLKDDRQRRCVRNPSYRCDHSPHQSTAINDKTLPLYLVPQNTPNPKYVYTVTNTVLVVTPIKAASMAHLTIHKDKAIVYTGAGAPSAPPSKAPSKSNKNEGSSLANCISTRVGTRRAFLKSNEINFHILGVALVKLVSCRDIKAELRENDGIHSPLLRLLEQVLYEERNTAKGRRACEKYKKTKQANFPHELNCVAKQLPVPGSLPHESTMKKYLPGRLRA